MLTRYLADRVRLVHAVELDEGLAAELGRRLEGRANVRVRASDAKRTAVTDSASWRSPVRRYSRRMTRRRRLGVIPIRVFSSWGSSDLPVFHCDPRNRNPAQRGFPERREVRLILIQCKGAAECARARRVSRTKISRADLLAAASPACPRMLPMKPTYFSRYSFNLSSFFR